MFSRLLTATTTLAAATSVLAMPAPSSQPWCGSAVYVLSNNPNAPNTIESYPILPDGTISTKSRTSTPTGGQGDASVKSTAPNAGFNGPDALNSQSSIFVSGPYLFAVNPGSNSVSMFSISPSDPTSLTMIGDGPVPVPGDFPTTVTASMKHRTVCVGTTGIKSGISCAEFDGESGISAKFDGLRDIGLMQTTEPPVGPAGTISQVFFSGETNQDGMLYATVKGNGMNSTGFFGAWDVEAGDCDKGEAGKVSMGQGVRTSPMGTSTLFGSFVVPGSGDVFVTDASFGAMVLEVDEKTMEASLLGREEITGQAATCWSAYSESSGSAWVTDGAKDTLVELSVDDASMISKVDLMTGYGDMLDLAAAGDFIYALGAPGIAVYNVKTKELVQHTTDTGLTKFAQGMAYSM